MRVLMTGGSGRLGLVLQEYMEAYAPSLEELDITQEMKGDWDLVIHCAAYTNVAQAEIERKKCFDVNVTGTLNLLNANKDTPFVYISSEYANKPLNFYALTKALGERLAETHPQHLIIRTLFKTRPFPYPTAYTDQYTQGDYLDVIAPLIVKEIKEWDRVSKMVYVGTGRKTMYDLARQSRDVKPISVDDIKTVKVPRDYL